MIRNSFVREYSVRRCTRIHRTLPCSVKSDVPVKKGRSSIERSRGVAGANQRINWILCVACVAHACGSMARKVIVYSGRIQSNEAEYSRSSQLSDLKELGLSREQVDRQEHSGVVCMSEAVQG